MQKRSLETREKIITAARQLFAEQGYDASGVAEVCAAAGVSKGAFYHHFASKQALFLFLLEDWLAELDERMTDIHRSADSVSEGLVAMAGMVQEALTVAVGRLPMFLEFWVQAGHDPVIGEAVVQPYRRYRDQFAAWIREGVRRGEFAPVDADLAARTLVSLAVGYILQGVMDPADMEWGGMLQRSVEKLMMDLRRQ